MISFVVLEFFLELINGIFSLKIDEFLLYSAIAKEKEVTEVIVIAEIAEENILFFLIFLNS